MSGEMAVLVESPVTGRENTSNSNASSTNQRNNTVEDPKQPSNEESTTTATVSSTSTAARAAAYGTLYGILLKVISFVLSQVTLRLVDPNVLGKASIRLDLMLSSALFLGREGFRLALIRSTDTTTTTATTTTRQNKKNTSDNIPISNVAWLSIPTGIVLSISCLMLHLYHCNRGKQDLGRNLERHHHLQEQEGELLDYQIAGILYCLAAVIETLAEPLVILYAMRNLDVQTRTTAEVIATFTKSIAVATMLAVYNTTDNYKFPVTTFGIGQVLYALLFTSIFYYKKWSDITWPTYNFHWPTVQLSGYFALQGIVKHLLTEGDRIILTTLAHSYDQGMYAMAQAYGGIISRLIFQPLEENARLLFSRQHRTILELQQQEKQRDTTKNNPKLTQQQPLAATSSSTTARDELETTFCVLVKLVLYVSLLSCIASNYTSILLRILAGSKWSSSSSSTNNSPSTVLSAFCYYTSLLALNGMTEAFVYGVVTQSEDVGKLGFVHGCVGLVFAVTAPILVQTYQTVGLVVANGISMMLRSAYSLYYAAGYFLSHASSSSYSLSKTTTHAFLRWSALSRLLKKLLPRTPVICAFIVALYITNYSRRKLTVDINDNADFFTLRAAQHVGIGIICTLIMLLIAVRTETDFRRSVIKLVRVKQD